VDVEHLTRQIAADARAERRGRLLARGGSAAYRDPDLHAAVERLLQAAVDRRDLDALALPELIGDEDEWRLQPYLKWSSHRSAGGPILFVKRRVLLPLMRWLYEFSLENFRRQERVNRVLFACVEQLALENAELRRALAARSPAGGPAASADR
jgi:hypothetical protein